MLVFLIPLPCIPYYGQEATCFPAGFGGYTWQEPPPWFTKQWWGPSQAETGPQKQKITVDACTQTTAEGEEKETQTQEEDIFQQQQLFIRHGEKDAALSPAASDVISSIQQLPVSTLGFGSE